MNAPTSPKQTAGPAPTRVPNSARRTSSIDVTWPDGRAAPSRLDARARDIVMSGSGDITYCVEDRYIARVQQDRTIVAMEAVPRERADLSPLVGQRGGGHLRRALQAIRPEERDFGTPLYLILDDFSGASLVSGWAQSQWDPKWRETARANMADGELEKFMANREGICTGFAPGSSALEVDFDQVGTNHGGAVSDLRNLMDPEGWHEFPAEDGMSFRRARRIDVRLAGDIICVESAFQDSTNLPQGGRKAVHEYTLGMTADAASLRILTISAQPRILPYPECPGATRNLPNIIGAPLLELRDIVPELFKGTAGCTHLNDAMRALSETPFLVDRLRAHEAA